jgi:hypothetical protein
MDQSTARRRAHELRQDGALAVAVQAARRPDGSWRVGGWPNRKDQTWIVAEADKRRPYGLVRVLEDEESTS